jgi:ssDNA-binding Zn-finger/Zn-ribbon topoisomerase 1
VAILLEYGNKIRILSGDKMSEIIKCPKCDSEIRIIKESNWDNLDTYLYPVCDNCKWTTKEVFYNIAQIKEHLKTNF